MKISNVFNNINTYNSKIKNDKKFSKTKTNNDSFSVSNEAKDFQTALKAVSKSPDIRKDKINEVINKIKSGTYNISSDDIANKILENK